MKKSAKNMERECLPIENLANLDMSREHVTGIPEVIFARNKEPEDVYKIASAILEKKGVVMITKALPEHVKILEEIKAVRTTNLKAGVVVLKTDKRDKPPIGKIAIFAAGTADIPVAEEARIVAETLGCATLLSYDVGVAGLHRVFPGIKRAIDEKADAVIVVAGMEGALASVVKGLIDVPVIGVPTSVGYGYGGEGISALMSMLQSCSPGITVVNIDNGFGAAAAAYLICRQVSRNKGE